MTEPQREIAGLVYKPLWETSEKVKLWRPRDLVIAILVRIGRGLLRHSSRPVENPHPGSNSNAESHMVRLFGIALVSILFASSPASAQPNFPFFEPVEPPRKIQVMVHRGMATGGPGEFRERPSRCAPKTSANGPRLTCGSRRMVATSSSTTTPSTGRRTVWGE